MHRLSLFGQQTSGPRRILAIGAHADDIEIGCGGTLLRLLEEHRDLDVTWVVFCSTAERAREASASAEAFLAGAASKRVVIKSYRDGFLPTEPVRVKEEFEALKAEVSPDLILTHAREDRHQDHRMLSDLAWNTWRNHLILEFEIPKYDGDFGSPSVFVPLSAATLERKIALVLKAFPTQAGKAWFTADLFRAVARIRGMECAAQEQLAEAFYCRKLVL
jgi:LmbE family N-acetylglucosaminyl deacetylase